jgi:DNA-binding transcriptional ArsR family regulator
MVVLLQLYCRNFLAQLRAEDRGLTIYADDSLAEYGTSVGNRIHTTIHWNNTGSRWLPILIFASFERDAPGNAARARPPLACRQSLCYILNLMVQYTRAHFDASFAALSDATRRGVLEQLGRADASITDLAEKFHMTLTGMKKHVGVLEQAGLVTTEKVGRVRTCKLGLRRLEEEAAWIQRYRQLWDARFDELDRVVEELKRQEKVDGRKKRK